MNTVIHNGNYVPLNSLSPVEQVRLAIKDYERTGATLAYLQLAAFAKIRGFAVVSGVKGLVPVKL